MGSGVPPEGDGSGGGSCGEGDSSPSWTSTKVMTFLRRRINNSIKFCATSSRIGRPDANTHPDPHLSISIPVDDDSHPTVCRYFHASGKVVGVVSLAIFQRMIMMRMMMIVVDEWKVGRQRLSALLFAVVRRRCWGIGGRRIGGESESIIGFHR